MLKELFNLFFKGPKKMEIQDTRKDFFETKEDYVRFMEAFKTHAKEKTLKSARYFLLRNILLNREFDSGFTPIRNVVKTENGLLPYGALISAYEELKKDIIGESEFFDLSDFTLVTLGDTLNSEDTQLFFKELYYAHYQL